MNNVQQRINTLQCKIAAMLNTGASTEVQFKEPSQAFRVQESLMAAERALSDAYWRAATNSKD